MRVLVSVLNATVAVVGKGSIFMLTDSNATARVEVDWLIRIGFLLTAATAVLLAAMKQNARRNRSVNPLRAAHEILVFIGRAPLKFPRTLHLSGEIFYNRGGGATRFKAQFERQYTMFDIQLVNRFRRPSARYSRRKKMRQEGLLVIYHWTFSHCSSRFNLEVQPLQAVTLKKRRRRGIR